MGPGRRSCARGVIQSMTLISITVCCGFGSTCFVSADMQAIVCSRCRCPLQRVAYPDLLTQPETEPAHRSRSQHFRNPGPGPTEMTPLHGQEPVHRNTSNPHRRRSRWFMSSPGQPIPHNSMISESRKSAHGHTWHHPCAQTIVLTERLGL